MKIVIVGGSDAGISAALRARELDVSAEVTLVLADSFPNYSVCGLPFFISGEVQDWHRLAHRTEFTGIQILTDCVVQRIGVAENAIVADHDGHSISIPYDRLLIATGAIPTRNDITGLDLAGVFTLRIMEDAIRLRDYIATRRPRNAIIAGGGYIGVEMADALTRRGIRATLVTSSAVLPTVDPELGSLIEDEMNRNGVRSVARTSLKRIEPTKNALRCFGTNGFDDTADLVVVAVGVQPNTTLAKDAGVELGVRGAIRVDRTMRTNIPEVFAAGDCVETWHQLLRRPTYLPLGTTAHKQGRVAGENIVGGHRLFAGSIGTQVVKVFDLAVARTGLHDRDGRAAGFDPTTCEITLWDHNPYYPDAKKITIRLTADRNTRRLLGAQLVGHWQTQISKRIDVVATALRQGMKIDDLDDLDLSYTPPFGTPWDAIQAAGHGWLEFEKQAITGAELK